MSTVLDAGAKRRAELTTTALAWRLQIRGVTHEGTDGKAGLPSETGRKRRKTEVDWGLPSYSRSVIIHPKERL